MFHRTLFKYLDNVKKATKSTVSSEGFSSPNAYYIMKEYYRLHFANEAEHESLDTLSYEFALLLNSVLTASIDEASPQITNYLLKHQFNTSLIFCEIDEVTLESLAYRQSHNYCWTIANQEPSTLPDTMRSYVDDVIDYVNFERECFSKDALKSFLLKKKQERGIPHKKLYEYLIKSNHNIIIEKSRIMLSEQARYFVQEYCRLLLIDEGGDYSNISLNFLARQV